MSDLTKKEFSYSAIDGDTANFLREKEKNISSIASRVFADVGRELSEAQEALAKHRYGCFEEWYSSLGFNKQTVYNYINYHRLIVQQLDKREMLEGLPKPVVYEIAKPTANPEIRQKVLDGELTTTRQLQAAIKAQKEAEQQAESERKRAENLAEALRNQKPQVIEKEVIKEVIPPEVGRQLQQLKDKNRELSTEVEARKDSTEHKLTVDGRVMHFNHRIQKFIEDMASLAYLGRQVMSASQQCRRDYERSLAALEHWIKDMRIELVTQPRSENIIDAEVRVINE